MDALQHCFPPNLRQYLNELPETLDETYEQILSDINQAQKDNAHRLLQCLTVAVRPLQVKELAELLAFDFQVSTARGMPTSKEDWRWDDEEEAVLSTCSSLITVIHHANTRVVQFSHFSVKEFLTSSPLARSPHGGVSRFHIDLEPAHTIMAQACLATLLRQDEHARIRNSDATVSPLLKYAAQQWVYHAQFENVSLLVRDGMDDMFDSSKPHFYAWIQVYDFDKKWSYYWSRKSLGSPLYYAAIYGLYDLVERLIAGHPEQVNTRGGHYLLPLPAALFKKHFRIANLLCTHGAVVDVQFADNFTLLHVASSNDQVDIMRWLLDHGADKNARTKYLWTPLYGAVLRPWSKAAQVLLEHNADANLQDIHGRTPLHRTLVHGMDRMLIDVVRRLLEHGADPNIRTNHTTPLHQASSHGSLEVARLLLSYGANVDEKDENGKTPLQVVASSRHEEMTKLLIEHGAVSQSQP